MPFSLPQLCAEQHALQPYLSWNIESKGTGEPDAMRLNIAAVLGTFGQLASSPKLLRTIRNATIAAAVIEDKLVESMRGP